MTEQPATPTFETRMVFEFGNPSPPALQVTIQGLNEEQMGRVRQCRDKIFAGGYSGIPWDSIHQNGTQGIIVRTDKPDIVNRLFEELQAHIPFAKPEAIREQITQTSADFAMPKFNVMFDQPNKSLQVDVICLSADQSRQAECIFKSLFLGEAGVTFIKGTNSSPATSYFLANLPTGDDVRRFWGELSRSVPFYQPQATSAQIQNATQALLDAQGIRK